MSLSLTNPRPRRLGLGLHPTPYCQPLTCILEIAAPLASFPIDKDSSPRTIPPTMPVKPAKPSPDNGDIEEEEEEEEEKGL